MRSRQGVQNNSRASFACSGFWEAGSLSPEENNHLLLPGNLRAQGCRSRAAVVKRCWRKGGRAVGGGRQKLSGCGGAGRRTQQEQGCQPHSLCPWQPASQVFRTGEPEDAWTGLHWLLEGGGVERTGEWGSVAALCRWLEGGGREGRKNPLQWLVLRLLKEACPQSLWMFTGFP